MPEWSKLNCWRQLAPNGARDRLKYTLSVAPKSPFPGLCTHFPAAVTVGCQLLTGTPVHQRNDLKGCLPSHPGGYPHPRDNSYPMTN